MILSHQHQLQQVTGREEEQEHRLSPLTSTLNQTRSSVPQDRSRVRRGGAHCFAIASSLTSPTSGQSRGSHPAAVAMITRDLNQPLNCNHERLPRLTNSKSISQSTQRKNPSALTKSTLFATLLLITTTTTTCLLLLEQIPASSGLLFEAADLSSAQASSSSSSSSSSAASNSQPQSLANGLIATIVDSAAKAALSSPSSSPSSSSSSLASEPPAPKSLGAPSPSPAAIASSSSQSSAASSRQSAVASSSPSSIVASLSSAVASAAVASAVAAARKSLAPSPFGSAAKRAASNAKLSSQASKQFGSQSTQARSSSTSSANQANSINNAKSNSNPASPLNHIAMRLADAIPEVPYNILHNMKKLDHAAPFYNVDSSPVSKASGSQASLAAAAGGGIRKESSQLSAALGSLLQSAISAASGVQSGGGGASSMEQIGALFRAPLWRRLAEGYGDFAAEFRSFFKPASASSSASPASALSGPSKASGALGQLPSLGSVSHLMRELSVSVPVVMYLANKAMKSDWRPTRTNRKSFMQNILGPQSSTPASLLPLESSASAVSASPLASSFLNSLDPMQMSGMDSASPSAAQLVGNQLLNAMQQQEHSQAQFFPSFVQSPLMQATQDVMQSQQQRGLNRRIGDQVVAEETDNLQNAHNNDNNLNGINLAASDHNDLMINAQKPVHANEVARRASPASNALKQPMNAPLTLLGDHLEARSMHGPNWLATSSPSQLGGASEAAKSAYEPGWLLSNSGKFLQNLLHNSAKSPSQKQSNEQQKRRQDDTKLIALNDKHRYSLVVDDYATDSAARLSASQNSLLAAVSHIIGLNSHSAKSSNQVLPSSASTFSESGSIGANRERLQATSGATSGPLPQPQAQTSSSSSPTSSSSPNGQPEQRDLSKLVPQAWKDAVKRTYSNVQQSASTQWRSIEGQISGWLKPGSANHATSLPGYHQPGTAPGPNAHNHFHTPTGGATGNQGAVSGFLSSVSSAAVNMLSLGGNKDKDKDKQHASSSASSQAPVVASSNVAPTSETSGNINSKQPASGKQTGLANMATLILNTITGQPKGNSATQSSGNNNQSQSSKTPTSSSVPPPTASQS